MSAFVLRFRASNALHCAKQYMYNGNTLHACSWVCTERRRYYAADASATTATTATAAAGNKEGGSGAQTNAEAEFLQKLRKRLDNEVQIGKVVPVFKKALYHGDRTAIKDENGEYSYHQIYGGATKLAAEISLLCEPKSESKIAFLCPNTAVYSVVQWACWISGQIAVPLSSRYPPNQLGYYIKDSDAQLIVTVPEFEPILRPLAESLNKTIKIVNHEYIPAIDDANPFPNKSTKSVLDGLPDAAFYTKSNALILYTSGSTGPPKGTVISHRNLQAQTSCLIDAWKINETDRLLHVLPLNHVHGCVNALLCPLNIGAKISMQRHFDPATVWSTLLNVNLPSKDRVNLFMAVPTIYSLLIAEYNKTFSKNDRMVEYIRAQCEKKIRLMISGSAPLPSTLFDTWKRITGHKLLERYGMTEIGMALSTPYVLDKTRDRVSGSVGHPLPDTEVKIVSDGKTLVQLKGESNKGVWSTDSVPVYQTIDGSNATTTASSISGELYVRGPSVFVEYYKKLDETKASFDKDGWFKTGDVAKYENGIFRISGRLNIDIIKSGGHKVSALEIETHILENEKIADVCVVGVPDPTETWGQIISALIVPRDASSTEVFDIDEFKVWLKANLASHQMPNEIQIVKALPRNEMGKVNKREIVREYFTKVAAAAKTETVTPTTTAASPSSK